MKKIVLFVMVLSVVLLPLRRADAALARGQIFSGSNTTFSSTVTTSPNVTVTAGNLVVCGVEADAVAANGVTVVDNKSNTWARAKSNSLAATFDLEIWYSTLTTGGGSYNVTATDNGGGVDSLIICEEWSGNAVAAFDVAQGATDNSGTNVNLNSAATSATSQANEVVFGVGVTSGTPTYTLGAGYTNLTRVATTFSSLGFESKIVSAAAAQTATLTASVAGSWVMQVSTFKELGGAATIFPRMIMNGPFILRGPMMLR